MNSYIAGMHRLNSSRTQLPSKRSHCSAMACSPAPAPTLPHPVLPARPGVWS